MQPNNYAFRLVMPLIAATFLPSIWADEKLNQKEPSTHATDQSGTTQQTPNHGPGRGQGMGRGRGMGGRGRGPMGMEDMRGDMTTLHAMFDARQKIIRNVTVTANGAIATTESNDKAVAALIQEHVPAMETRVHENKPLPPMTFHPVFKELIKHASDYSLTYENTPKGIKATYAAKDPFVVMLVQEHAKLVSRFIKNGMDEIHKPYALPQMTAATKKPNKKAQPTYVNPTIVGYGKVTQLPKASQQPRSGSKIVVDVIKGGDPDKLNPAIEKLARFVNIYQGAGAEPADVEIAVVLHGDTTLAVLNSESYAARFQTEGNPNLDCLNKLHNAGVRIFVCGQSLIGKDGHPDEVAPSAEVAVSALTSLVNLQSDGFSYVLLGK